MRTIYLVLWLVASGVALYGQPINDNCASAFNIPNTDTWCSAPGAYTNVNATPYTGTPPTNPCFLDLTNEVWFTFIPQTPAIYFRISGAVNGLGTLRNPAIAVFDGSCTNLNRVGCNIVSSTTNQVELSVTGLVIGQVYYLLVEGQNDFEGTFQICLEGFIPPPIPQSDCGEAVILCDKSEFVIDTILGVGQQDPGVTNTCVFQELSSVWYSWTVETTGILTFILTPNNFQQGFESDDIDFVIYKLPGGLDDCANKEVVRCMAAGSNGTQFQDWQRCNGPTGLRPGSTDVTEDAGCMEADDDSWLKPMDVVAGESYTMLINNFSQTGLGFSIEWGGTATFQGPKPAFDVSAVQAFECDKTIIFDNQSLAPTDSIVSYLWNFGAGANPQSSDSIGPISVIYDSFGPKKVALTVTSSKGCEVTEILDFFIEPCCADTSTLGVSAIITDQLCPGTATGVIQGVGISGAPLYQYSLDCVDYQPSSVFPALIPGDYTLCIQDEKGCENQVDITVLPANGYGVEAGDTIFVQLGDSSQINAVAFPNLPSAVVWNNLNTLRFNGTDITSLLNPTVRPRRSGWYTVTITNEAGCTTTDSVFVLVDVFKPVYIPNVITANQDDINDRVTIYSNGAATGVEAFQIFDRWGGLMWEGKGDMLLNNPSMGWDGTFKGQPVNTGVYSYRAVIEFYDELPLAYTGTITVLR
ncbi:MAG: gliding motility-associated C-terminal domain-containing protein [Bacteroidota bacterium]|nr:gliding motility-associated C-terminal domain-containing protein [Bacteroidota bacterium]